MKSLPLDVAVSSCTCASLDPANGYVIASDSLEWTESTETVAEVVNMYDR